WRTRATTSAPGRAARGSASTTCAAGCGPCTATRPAWRSRPGATSSASRCGCRSSASPRRPRLPPPRGPPARARRAPARAARRRRHRMPSGGETLRVVIVDDEELARRGMRRDLAKEAGIEVASDCADGFDAVRVITESRPDLVFLDIQMPRLDGFEVLELL